LVDACDVVPSAEALVSDTEDFAAEVKRLSPVEEPVAVSTRSVRLLMPVPVPVLPVGRLSEERPLVIEDKLPIDGSALPPVRELSPARPLPVVREDREDVLGKTPDVPLLGSRLVRSRWASRTPSGGACALELLARTEQPLRVGRWSVESASRRLAGVGAVLSWTVSGCSRLGKWDSEQTACRSYRSCVAKTKGYGRSLTHAMPGTCAWDVTS